MLLSTKCLIFTLVFLLNTSYILSQTDNYGVVRPGGTSFAEQVIDIAKNYNNNSVTIFVKPGRYYSTNGSNINFINYTNVIIKKDPNDTGTVDIECQPENLSLARFNSIGFNSGFNISISDVSFSRCGPRSAGIYISGITNLEISDSIFHHNTDNGLQMVSCNNIVVRNCHFYSSVGLQPDVNSNLFSTIIFDPTGGVGIGAYFRDQVDVRISIENCTFENNIAYKRPNYNPATDRRPYGFIPFGNGGGVYLQFNQVTNLSAYISNTKFYNNSAIHQGGAIAMISLDSVHCLVDVSGCEFIGNRALGNFLRLRNETIIDFDTDRFINEIDQVFSTITDGLTGLPLSGGGIGSGISASLYGSSEFNELRVRNSKFTNNWAVISGAIVLLVRSSLTLVENGVNTNSAVIRNCTFISNFALLTGSAVGVASYSRVDVGSYPTVIEDCTFENNSIFLQPGSSLLIYQYNTVIGLRLPVEFKGRNIFHSNIGGGVNMNHARLTIGGHLEFLHNRGGTFGGAIRLGELALMQVLPNTTITFINNTASQLGGGIAAGNFRAGNDITLLLNYVCFIQYNIGGEHENEPDLWTVKFVFENNRVEENGQGQAFFADDISQCVIGQGSAAKNPAEFFNASIFSPKISIFNFSQSVNETKPYFETAPHVLILQNNNRSVSLGEIFTLHLHVEDQDGNLQDAVYSYYRNPTAPPSNVLVVDLDPQEETASNFAAVNDRTSQNTSLVMHNNELMSNCPVNRRTSLSFPSMFVLNLVDSSNGQQVNTLAIDVNIRCCHVGHQYNNTHGLCVFIYGNNVIIRQDQTNRYIYVRSDRYGGFDDDGRFLTARIPPTYQFCTQEGRLSGCLVMDDDLDQQCSQGRTDFLCGKCPSNSNKGTALNLIECVSCEAWHIAMLIFICILIIVVSFLIMYYNVRLPNTLKGFLFYSQVLGYIYQVGATNGNIQWHFYLSRFAGFSLFFPLCISPHMDTVEVAMLGFVTPVLMAMCATIYIILARFSPHLSKRKTVDGIWFLILIIYVYTADTCLNLLACVQVYEPIEFRGKRVYYFDGTLECFAGQHLPYGVIAIVVSVLVLIPLPTYVLAVSFNYIKKAGPIRDVISSGIDNKCHWWSGYDLLRRLMFFIVYLMFENFSSDYTQFALTLTALLILVITARVRPYAYDCKWVNVIEVLILLDLVLLSAYFLDNDRLLDTANNDFAVLLLIIPFIYFGLYILFKAVDKCRKRYVSSSTNELIETNSISLISGTLRHWSSYLSSSSQQRTPRTVQLSSFEDSSAQYEMYRDELEEYVTINWPLEK